MLDLWGLCEPRVIKNKMKKRLRRLRVDGATKCANIWPAVLACKNLAARIFDRLRVNGVSDAVL